MTILVQRQAAIGRFVVGLSLATELWYDTRANGERSYRIVGFGYSERGGMRVWALHLFGLVLRAGRA